MRDAVIVSAVRSPIGRAHKGSLVSLRPDDLAAQLVRAAVDAAGGLEGVPIDDLMLGCGLPGGEAGYNIARVAAVLAGRDEAPGVTVNRYCASSLQAARMALHAIRAGEGDVFIAAGVEAVSRTVNGTTDWLPGTQNPAFAEAAARTEATAREGGTWRDPREDGLLPDVYISMGLTAENVAQVHGISRADQDAYAVASQNRVEAAGAAGVWAAEITPVTLADGSVVSADDSPRAGVTLESVGKLAPVFRPDGTVTAGNACPLNDGAAALVIMSAEKAAALGLEPLARIVSTGVSALSPEIMGLGPVDASRQALAGAGMTIDDVDLVEINEAFAAQVIASARELGVEHDRLNVHGGAIALGHPFGMSGARIAVTLLNALRARDQEIGLESMCIGGGQGMAMVVQRLS